MQPQRRLATPRSPGLEECGSDATRQPSVVLAEDPPCRARGARVVRLEVDASKAEPGLRRIVLQPDCVAEGVERLGRSPELGVRVAEVDVGEDVAGVDLHRALQGLERLGRTLW